MLPEQRGVIALLKRGHGTTFTSLANRNVSFRGLAAVNPSVVPPIEFFDDPRSKCLVECLRPIPPEIVKQSIVRDDNGGKWAVVVRDDNTVDFTVKLWLVQVI